VTVPAAGESDTRSMTGTYIAVIGVEALVIFVLFLLNWIYM
jgi:hypothetical protein